MIKQSNLGLTSRSLANPYDEDGFLPLITSPMYSVVDKDNYKVFLDNKIRVCLPRKSGKNKDNFDTSYPFFISLSLKEFTEQYVTEGNSLKGFAKKICIDTANGNNPDLHLAIKQAKKIHGSNLIIMAGNVSSIEAFTELAKTGVDYIRVGIGGGAGCNTTSNTGVGQEDLEKLIKKCRSVVDWCSLDKLEANMESVIDEFKYLYTERRKNILTEEYGHNYSSIGKVKIVADGISSYIKQCESKYGFNDNGYAAINKLLFAGADLVMVGKLFAQCLESAGEKKSRFISDEQIETVKNKPHLWYKLSDINKGDITDCKLMFTKYSGMSTQEEQKKYKDAVFFDIQNDMQSTDKDGNPIIKPSEGTSDWIPVRWTLDEWLHGSDNQDSYPFLMGWVNSIKSAMAYNGKRALK